MFGFLNVYKPVGPTSHDIVGRVRRKVGRGVKVGHAGTLDPFADGVLVLGVGRATRLADYVQAQPKRYLAEVTLGATSTTDDSEGEIRPEAAAEAPPLDEIRGVVGGYVGRIRQVPPAHSAVHVQGRRAYKLAREGRPVDLAPREVTVNGIFVVEYAYPRLRLDVMCGKGTYVRALARDIGRALEVGGYCSGLTRTAVGVFRLEQAVRTEGLEPARDVLDPLLALASFEKITVAEADTGRVARGLSVAVGQEVTRAVQAGGYRSVSFSREVVLVSTAGALLAIGRLTSDARAVRPTKVFTPVG